MDELVTLRHKVSCYLAGLLVATPLIVNAITMVNVKVTVVAPPPCVINNDRPIEVEFGDVMTTRVDGKNYRMPVSYSLSCAGVTSNAMKIQVKGTGASFDGTVIQTNKEGLGIELKHGDSKLAVNSWLNFTYPNQPDLWAVPVKKSNMVLTGGEFSAGATMQVAYQ